MSAPKKKAKGAWRVGARYAVPLVALARCSRHALLSGHGFGLCWLKSNKLGTYPAGKKKPLKRLLCMVKYQKRTLKTLHH